MKKGLLFRSTGVRFPQVPRTARSVYSRTLGTCLIHLECPEEPQIRLESGGEAERSPNLYQTFYTAPRHHCAIVCSHILYLPGSGAREINKPWPWYGASHCPLVIQSIMTSIQMDVCQPHHFCTRGNCVHVTPQPDSIQSQENIFLYIFPESLRLLMWGATMAWEAGEICWE